MTPQEQAAEILTLKERLNRSEADRERLREKLELQGNRIDQMREQLRAMLESIEQ